MVEAPYRSQTEMVRTDLWEMITRFITGEYSVIVRKMTVPAHQVQEQGYYYPTPRTVDEMSVFRAEVYKQGWNDVTVIINLDNSMTDEDAIADAKQIDIAEYVSQLNK